jgi:polynucleotide 5'-kinase involved in rRNA processing
VPGNEYQAAYSVRSEIQEWRERLMERYAYTAINVNDVKMGGTFCGWNTKKAAQSIAYTKRVTA